MHPAAPAHPPVPKATCEPARRSRPPPRHRGRRRRPGNPPDRSPRHARHPSPRLACSKSLARHDRSAQHNPRPLCPPQRHHSPRASCCVLSALDQLGRRNGQEIETSPARRPELAGLAVDPVLFLYRHHDLRARIHARAATPGTSPASTTASRQSLLADLANPQRAQPAAPAARTTSTHRPALGGARRGGLPRQRHRPRRRRRTTTSPCRRARTAAPRPAPRTRRADRRTRRSPRRQPRP